MTSIAASSPRVCASVRALRGFPLQAGDLFEPSTDATSAIVEITLFLAPSAPSASSSPPPSSSSSTTPVVRIHRSLADLLELEAQLHLPKRTVSPAPCLLKGAVTRLADALALQEDANGENLPRGAQVPIQRATQRLLGHVEALLASCLDSSCVAASEATEGLARVAFQAFVHPLAPVMRPEASLEETQCAVDALVARALSASTQPGQSEQEEHMLMGGCSWSQRIRIRSTAAAGDDEDGVVVGAVDDEEQAPRLLVVWQFAFDGDAIDLEIRHVAHDGEEEDDEDGKGQADKDGNEEVDPYSEAACYADANADVVKAQEDTGHEQVVQFRTRYMTHGGARMLTGVWAPTENVNGYMVLHWTSAETGSIFTRALRVTVRTIPVPVGMAAGSDAVAELLARVTPSSSSPPPPTWLTTLVQSAPEVPYDEEEEQEDDEELGGYSHARGGRVEEEETSVQQQQSAHRTRALEGQVFTLEEELRRVRQELRAAKDELEISSEVYKASLETISQLEMATPTPVVPATATASLSDGGGDLSDLEEELEREREEEAAAAVTAEHIKLRELCASFQEQCLWRSIETSESEKRNLVLESQLEALRSHAQSLEATVAGHDSAQALLEHENRTLRAQKRVLVDEVKRLQPYSHANLTALIQDAEEARMMQRSLQTQLATLQLQLEQQQTPANGEAEDEDANPEVVGPVAPPECVPERVE